MLYCVLMWAADKGFDVPDIALKLSFWMKDMMSVAFIGNPPQAMIKEFGTVLAHHTMC